MQLLDKGVQKKTQQNVICSGKWWLRIIDSDITRYIHLCFGKETIIGQTVRFINKTYKWKFPETLVKSCPESDMLINIGNLRMPQWPYPFHTSNLWKSVRINWVGYIHYEVSCKNDFKHLEVRINCMLGDASDAHLQLSRCLKYECNFFSSRTKTNTYIQT